MFCYFSKRMRKISALSLFLKRLITCQSSWFILPLRILTWKTQHQIKPKSLEKYEYGYLGNRYIKSTFFKRFLYSNLIFKKLMIGLFCTHHLICLDIGFCRAVSYGNVTLSIVVLSTKKRYSNFVKNISVFQRPCFKFKALITFSPI